MSAAKAEYFATVNQWIEDTRGIPKESIEWVPMDRVTFHVTDLPAFLERFQRLFLPANHTELAGPSQTAEPLTAP